MTPGAERGLMYLMLGVAYVAAVLLGVEHGIWVCLWLTIGGNVLCVVWTWRIRWWLIARRRRRELLAWRRFQAGRSGIAPNRPLP